MKKIILSLLSAGLIVNSSNAQIAIAPELGVNLANMSITNTTTSMKAGLAVGGVVDFGFTKNLYLQPGLFYLMNGCSFTGGSMSVNTIEIPVNVEYKLGDEGSNRFFFGAGPYLGYNVGGTIKNGGQSASLKIGSAKADLNSSGDDIKALDLGIGVNIGYLLANGFYVRAHYQAGLTNLDPSGGSSSIKTSAIGITVGYYFGAKKAQGGK